MQNCSPLLDGLCGLEGLLRRHPHLALPQQRLDEVGDVAACDRDVLDAAPDYVTLRLRKKNAAQQHIRFRTGYVQYQLKILYKRSIYAMTISLCHVGIRSNVFFFAIRRIQNTVRTEKPTRS